MKYFQLVISLSAILTGSFASPISAGFDLATRDACTTNKIQWTADCEYGANVCCSKINTSETQCLASDGVSSWCNNHFSGQNCAHAYNEGSRYIERLTGGYCGI